MENIESIKYKLEQQVSKSIDEAFNLGQSEEVKELKKRLEETLKYSQEAYEFYKVVCNRFCISENNLESTTKNYLHEIGNQLRNIEGIKK